jgi:hypothetical protein
MPSPTSRQTFWTCSRHSRRGVFVRILLGLHVFDADISKPAPEERARRSLNLDHPDASSGSCDLAQEATAQAEATLEGADFPDGTISEGSVHSHPLGDNPSEDALFDINDTLGADLTLAMDSEFDEFLKETASFASIKGHQKRSRCSSSVAIVSDDEDNDNDSNSNNDADYDSAHDAGHNANHNADHDADHDGAAADHENDGHDDTTAILEDTAQAVPRNSHQLLNQSHGPSHRAAPSDTSDNDDLIVLAPGSPLTPSLLPTAPKPRPIKKFTGAAHLVMPSPLPPSNSPRLSSHHAPTSDRDGPIPLPSDEPNEHNTSWDDDEEWGGISMAEDDESSDDDNGTGGHVDHSRLHDTTILSTVNAGADRVDTDVVVDVTTNNSHANGVEDVLLADDSVERGAEDVTPGDDSPKESAEDIILVNNNSSTCQDSTVALIAGTNPNTHDGSTLSNSSNVSGAVADVHARHSPAKLSEGLNTLITSRASRRRAPGGALLSVSADMSPESIVDVTVSNIDMSDWLVNGTKFIIHVHDTTQYGYFNKIAAAYILLEASHGFRDDNVSDLHSPCPYTNEFSSETDQDKVLTCWHDAMDEEG